MECVYWLLDMRYLFLYQTRCLSELNLADLDPRRVGEKVRDKCTAMPFFDACEIHHTHNFLG